MNLERINSVLLLNITDDTYMYFRDEWVEQLRALPYDQFGAFMRDIIYPALTAKERQIWNKATISNRDLFNAVQAYV